MGWLRASLLPDSEGAQSGKALACLMRTVELLGEKMRCDDPQML